MLGRVRNVICTADDMGDPVEHVFERGHEVVGRPAVRADDHDVLELLVRVFDPSENQIVPGSDPLVGHAEADRAFVLVGLFLGDEPLCDLLGFLDPIELEGHVCIPVEAEPPKRLLDLVRCCSDFSARVGVLDPQSKLAFLVAGEKPVEKRRVHAADVEEAGRTRRKADSDGHVSSVLPCPQGSRR